MATSKSVQLRLIIAIAVIALVLGWSTVIAGPTVVPVFNPETSISRSGGAIKIDGRLDDAGWTGASIITNFVENYPGDNTPPDVRTKAFMTFDAGHLYLAFKCYDNPAEIRSTMCQRDRFNGDDAVGIKIDTYGDASWAYLLFVNAHGVQKDYLWTNVAGEDIGFDLIWESAAIITTDGYQVEMAIPFSSLRFPNRTDQSWRLDLARNRPREAYHQYSWAAYDRNEQCSPCQWGTVTGIADVEPGKGLEVLPTYVAFQNGHLEDPGDPRSEFTNDDILGQLSLGGKYGFSSDITLEATYNPDFSQIEADAAQIDVNSTVALFYPERRPFFQEGADVFRTLFNSFYTRTVYDPEYAVKLIARKPGFTLGVMSAQDERTAYLVPLDERSETFLANRSWVNVIRGTHEIGNASQVGFIVTDRRMEGGGYGSILAADGSFRLNQSFSFDGQYIYSFTGEPDKAGASSRLAGVTFDNGTKTAIFDGESFNGDALIARVRRSGRHWNSNISYSQVDPSYRTLTGYDPWINYRSLAMWNGYTLYPEGTIFQRITPQLWMEGRWRYDGTRQWESQNFSVNFQFRWAQSYFSPHVSRGTSAWTSDVTSELIHYKGLYTAGFEAGSRLTNQVGVNVSIEHGRQVAQFADAIGNESHVFASLDLKPIDRLTIEPDINFVNSSHVDTDRELFKQFIARTRFSVQMNRQLSLRLVVQYNDSRAAILTELTDSGPQYFEWKRRVWDVDPLITYQLSSFSVLHVGSTHHYNLFPATEQFNETWQLSSRQFFIKLQYLFQV